MEGWNFPNRGCAAAEGAQRAASPQLGRAGLPEPKETAGPEDRWGAGGYPGRVFFWTSFRGNDVERPRAVFFGLPFYVCGALSSFFWEEASCSTDLGGLERPVKLSTKRQVPFFTAARGGLGCGLLLEAWRPV